LVNEIILYYDARSKKHQRKTNFLIVFDALTDKIPRKI